MLPSEVFYQDYSLWGEISNFLQPKLAVSSKKLHASLAHVPTGAPVHHFSEGSGQQQAATVPPQYNPGELSFQMHSCQYPHALPCCWFAHQFSCLNKTIPSHTQPVCHPGFSPRPPSYNASLQWWEGARQTAWVQGFPPPPLCCYSHPLSRSTAKAI